MGIPETLADISASFIILGFAVMLSHFNKRISYWAEDKKINRPRLMWTLFVVALIFFILSELSGTPRM